MADALIDLVDAGEATDHLTNAGLTAPANLGEIITGVSAAMQSYANRRFVEQEYTATVDGPGGARLSLPNFPITAVTSFSVDGVEWPEATTATSRGHVFSDTQVMLRGGIICRGIQNVEITYTAGFDPVPADVRLACCEGIAAVVASFEYNDPRAVEVRSGGTSIKLATADLRKRCLTDFVTGVLDELKRVTPC